MTDRLAVARRRLADCLVRLAAVIDPDWHVRTRRVSLLVPGREADIARRVRDTGQVQP